MDQDESAELVERLVSIGLDEREARVYVHLCERGAARASDAAAAVRLKRTETYRTLEALMKRGFITARLTRPVEYEAVPPETVFALLLAQHEERRTEIERLRERVAELSAQARERDGSGRHAYKILQGRRAIHAAVEAMLRRAQQGQSMVSTTFSPAQATNANRAFAATVRRAAEGFPMRVLLREMPGLERALEPLTTHPNVRVRYYAPEHPARFVITDRREILVWLVSDPSTSLDAREDVAMWTNAPDFVRLHETLYEALWDAGREPVRLRTH